MSGHILAISKYEDWYGCVQFYVEGYQKVKEKLKLKEIVK